jgi:hypothetical protein
MYKSWLWRTTWHVTIEQIMLWLMVMTAASILRMRVPAVAASRHRLAEWRRWRLPLGAHGKQVGSWSSLAVAKLTSWCDVDHHCLLYAGGLLLLLSRRHRRLQKCYKSSFLHSRRSWPGGRRSSLCGRRRPGSPRWPRSRSAPTLTANGQKLRLLERSTSTRCKHTPPALGIPLVLTRC